MLRVHFPGLNFLFLVVAFAIGVAALQKRARDIDPRRINDAVSSRIVEEDIVIAPSSLRDNATKPQHPVAAKKAPTEAVRREHSQLQSESNALGKSQAHSKPQKKSANSEESKSRVEEVIRPELAVPRNLTDEGSLKSRWIDTLSGRKNHELAFTLKSRKDVCSKNNISECNLPAQKDARIIGIVLNTDDLALNNEITDGHFAEGTPALYVK